MKGSNMPYVWYDTVPDGMEESQVYSSDDYDSVVAERDSIQAAFDAASNENIELKESLKAEKSKFAKAFLDKSASKKAKKPTGRKPVTADNLF